MTALQAAIFAKDLPMVHQLLHMNADPHAEDIDGRNARELAKDKAFPQAVKLLPRRMQGRKKKWF